VAPRHRDPEDSLSGDTVSSAARQPAPPKRALEAGSRVSRYVVLERLGSGGMGEIYAAYDPELDRRVAVKLMRGDVLSALGTHSGRARLLAEAKALARLSHPNVVAVHDVGEVEDEIFIAMELVEGDDLREWLAAAPRSTAEVLEVFKMAGRGLAAAHAVGLVHRDFKPLNVLVGRDGRARVVDFGLARAAGAPSPADAREGNESLPVLGPVETTVGALSGTPAYMSPEQLRQQSIDARTDQFSFAVALHEALCGWRPFIAAAPETPAAQLKAIEHGLGAPPPKSSMPPWIHAVLARALSADREARFPSMDALLEALEQDPTARRRKRWNQAGVALAVAAMVLGVVVARAAAQQRCAAPASRWAGQWDLARKASLRKAFAATGKPFAAAASDAVDRALDRYRADWLSMHQAACLATLNGAQAQDVLELRTECLDRRLAGAGALVEQLSRADEAVVKNAARAVDNLQPLSDCADAQALRAGAAWPLEPARRGQVEAVRAQVTQARALYAVGQSQAALEASDRATRAAEATGYLPLVADSALLLAQAHSLRREMKEAVAPAHRAAQAAEATGQLDLVVQAWTLLTRATAIEGEDGSVWAGYAEAMLGRVSGDTRGLLARLRLAQAAQAIQDRRYQRALDLARESLSISERASGEAHAQVGEALGTISTAAWYLGDLDAAAAAAERAADAARSSLGPEHPAYADHLRNLAGIRVERGDWEDAVRLTERAEAVYRRVLPPDHPFFTVTALYRAQALGHLEVEQGTSLGAEAMLREMLRRLQQEKDEAKVLAASSSLGLVLRLHGKCPEAISILERDVDRLDPQASTAEDRWVLAELREGLGACLLVTGSTARARVALASSVKWFVDNGTRNFLRAEGQFLLAQAEWQAGAREDARKDAAEARELMRAVGPRGQKMLPEVDRWRAEH